MRIAIIGRSEIMYKTLESCLEHNHIVPLIITAKEAPEYLKTSKDFEAIAHEINADFIMTSKLEGQDIINRIKNANCDIALSINFSGIISQTIIDLFPHGILNAHGGIFQDIEEMLVRHGQSLMEKRPLGYAFIKWRVIIWMAEK